MDRRPPSPSSPPGGDSAPLRNRLESLPPDVLRQLRRRLSERQQSAPALVAASLKACGIREVLGMTGVPVGPVFRECALAGLRPLGARHQQGATLMAAAANYFAGSLRTAVLVSAGPAATNTITGILVARDNGWPLLILGGRKSLAEEGRGHFQELDTVPLMSPLTKAAGTVRNAAEIPAVIRDLSRLAMSGRPGPVYLDLPEDVLLSHAVAPGNDGGSLAPDEPADTLPPIGRDLVEAVAQSLDSARRPLLLLGEDLRWSVDFAAVRRWTERMGLPFASTSQARGYLPDDHPLCANDVRAWAQGQADVVLVAGASLDWRFRFGTQLAPDARVIHAGYPGTRPPRHPSISVAFEGDPGRFMNALADAVRSPAGAGSSSRTAWLAAISEARDSARVEAGPWLERRSQPMAPQELLQRLQASIPGEAIVAIEGNVALGTAHRVLSVRSPLSWIDPGWNGCIGSALPFALGAKLVHPDRPVFAVCSDFGFGISGLELDTAIRHALPVVIVVVNNGGHGGSLTQRAVMPPDHPERFALCAPEVRYEQIAAAMGAYGESVESVDALPAAVARALQSNRVALLHVRVDPEAPLPAIR